MRSRVREEKSRKPSSEERATRCSLRAGAASPAREQDRELGPDRDVGASARSLTGVSQDDRFHTNVVPADMRETEAVVSVVVRRRDGGVVATASVRRAALGFAQLNLANELGVTSVSNGSVLVARPTAGAQVAACAYVIDATTSDSRTILARRPGERKGGRSRGKRDGLSKPGAPPPGNGSPRCGTTGAFHASH